VFNGLLMAFSAETCSPQTLRVVNEVSVFTVINSLLFCLPQIKRLLCEAQFIRHKNAVWLLYKHQLISAIYCYNHTILPQLLWVNCEVP
jgi:hypothetical protein